MAWLLAGAHFAMLVLQITVFGMMINHAAAQLDRFKAERAERQEWERSFVAATAAACGVVERGQL
jgi:hypothetical protein